MDKQPIMAYNGGMILVRFLPFLLAIACLPAFAAPRPALHIRVVVPDPGMRRNLGIVSVAFSPNGRILATGGSDGEIRLWDARTGQRRGQWRAGRASASGLAFSPDGRWVISQVSFLKWGRGQAQVWDARTHHLRWARPCNALSDGVALSPNGRLLAVGSEVKYAVPKGYHVPYGGSSRGGGVCRREKNRAPRRNRRHRCGIAAGLLGLILRGTGLRDGHAARLSVILLASRPTFARKVSDSH